MTFVLSVLLAVPFILHQIWAFISPGLYQHEKRFAIPLLLSGIALFFLGIAFAHFLVLPLAFGFFTAAGPEGISYLPVILSILDIILTVFFAFGLAYVLTIGTFLLVLSAFNRA